MINHAMCIVSVLPVLGEHGLVHGNMNHVPKAIAKNALKKLHGIGKTINQTVI